MNNKKYLAKIIAKDPSGLQIISACCSEGKVKIEEIKFLKKNKLFLLSIQRLNKESGNNEKINSICKFEFVDNVKSKNINQNDNSGVLELLAIDLFKVGEKYVEVTCPIALPSSIAWHPSGRTFFGSRVRIPTNCFLTGDFKYGRPNAFFPIKSFFFFETIHSIPKS